MKHQQRSWTIGEEQTLRTLAALGEEQLALLLNRSRDCVRKKASRLGVSVKKKTQISVTELSQAAIERIRNRDDALLCPGCGKRLAGPHGICGVCHKQALIDAHNERLTEIAAQRDLWRAQQQVSRARRALNSEFLGTDEHQEDLRLNTGCGQTPSSSCLIQMR